MHDIIIHRDLLPEQAKVFVPIAQEAHAASSVYRNIPFVANHVIRCIIGWSRASDFLCMTAEEEGETVGAFVGSVCSYMFNEESFARDIFIYIKPEHRKGNLFSRMLSVFRDWAKESGARRLVLSITFDDRAEKVSNLYQRMGMERIGYIHAQEISYGVR